LRDRGGLEYRGCRGMAVEGHRRVEWASDQQKTYFGYGFGDRNVRWNPGGSNAVWCNARAGGRGFCADPSGAKNGAKTGWRARWLRLLPWSSPVPFWPSPRVATAARARGTPRQKMGTYFWKGRRMKFKSKAWLCCSRWLLRVAASTSALSCRSVARLCAAFHVRVVPDPGVAGLRTTKSTRGPPVPPSPPCQHECVGWGPYQPKLLWSPMRGSIGRFGRP